MFYAILCSFIMSIMHLVNCILYCVWTSGPQYEGTCPWTLGQVAMEGFLVLERLQHCSRLLHAQLGGSDPCSEGRGYNAARIIQSYNHTIKGRLLQFNVVCSTFVSASSPDLSLISTTYRHCNLEYI